MLKKKSIYMKYLCLLSQKFPPGLPDLGILIRCAQDWYTAVRTDLKYPLMVEQNLYWAEVNLF